MKYTQHPLSAAFPSMDKGDYSALVADIRQHGQRDMATIYDGMVIDGWHRYSACEELEIPCRFEEFTGVDAVAFVRSKNQHRRHYQKSQQAAIEVSLTAWACSHRPNKGEAASPFSTNKEMAQRAGTTERTIQHAKRAHESGLGDMVRDGKISAEKAADLAKSSPELAKQVAHGEISLPKAIKSITPQKPGSEYKTAKIDQKEHPEFDEDAIRAEMDSEFDPVAELETTHKEIDRLTKVIESDDQLAAAMAENKRLTELCRVLEERMRGFQSSENAAKQAAKMWKNKFEKLEKQMKASGLVEF